MTSKAMARKETNFKQTDIGLIPHDWEVEEIIDIASISTGGQNTQDAKDGGLYPFYVRSPKVERINSYLYDTEGVVTAGDGVGVGKVFHYVNGKFGLHQRCYLIHRFKGVWAKYFYMYFSLQFYNRVMSMTAKSSVDSVRRDMIAHMLIPLPPIEEQKRIAEVLSHFDEHIDNLVALLEKRKQVKAATMHALLSGATRLPGFTAPWINKYLREITSVIRGEILVSSDFKDGPIPVIGGGTTIAGFHNKANREGKTITISASGANAGYVSFYTMPIFASDCCTLSEGKVYDIEYLYQYLRSVQNEIYRMQTGGAQPHIYPKDIESLWISMPASVTEQSAIASVLSNMDRGIEALEEQVEKYRQMKEGAMEELLTGKVRLV